MVCDAFLVVVMDGSGVIHTDCTESLDALELRELEEAIALSLATGAPVEPESPPEAPRPKARPPPAPIVSTQPRSIPIIERPALVPFNRLPSEPMPPPPELDPTVRQRVEAYRRNGSLPTLFPPTGTAWANSALAKARPPVIPELPPRFRVLHADPERLAFFPSLPQGPPLRFVPDPAMSSIHEGDTESSDDGERDVDSIASTAPSHFWEDW